MSSDHDKVKKTERGAKYWKYAAWTLPFVALAALIFSEYLGINSFYKKIITITVTVFFGTSVFWWWWALDKLTFLVKTMQKTSENFNEVKENIREVKEDIHDDSNRQR